MAEDTRWARPREGKHDTAASNIMNSISEVSKSVGMEKEAVSPATLWFNKISDALRRMDGEFEELAQRLQPALTPGFHGDDSCENAEADAKESLLVEELKRIYDRVNAHVDNIKIVTKRVEL